MWTDNETSEDLLGFSVHTSIIKKVVMNENNLPITIGLYGEWGSGKSSLLKIIENELNKDKDTVVIYFDGWSFESFDDAKMALIQGIIDELERNEKFLNKVEDKLNGIFKKLKKSVNWMRVLQTGVKTIIPIASAAYTGGASLIPLLISAFNDNR
ncbi:MAG: P-loop NTPase fold protein, partial [Bacteroidales bacterium]